MRGDSEVPVPARGRLRRSTIREIIHLTDNFVRIILDGDLHNFVDNGTDQHIAIYFYPPEAIVPESLSPENLAALHEFAMPQVRRYTIRSFDGGVGSVEVDVVKHMFGLASTWATTATVGDNVIWWGATDAWPPEVEVDVIGIDADQRYLPHQLTNSTSLPDVLRSTIRDSTTVWAGAEYRDAGAMRRLLIGEMGMTARQARITACWIAGQPQDKRPDERNRRKNQENRAADPERAARFIR